MRKLMTISQQVDDAWNQRERQKLREELARLEQARIAEARRIVEGESGQSFFIGVFWATFFMGVLVAVVTCMWWAPKVWDWMQVAFGGGR